jgi:hypothetical protein
LEIQCVTQEESHTADVRFERALNEKMALRCPKGGRRPTAAAAATLQFHFCTSCNDFFHNPQPSLPLFKKTQKFGYFTIHRHRRGGRPGWGGVVWLGLLLQQKVFLGIIWGNSISNTANVIYS